MTCSLDDFWNWQKLPLTGKRNWEESDNMVPVSATATGPTVLTLLLKQAQLFMRAKLNQTVGMAEKACLWSLFYLESHLKKGGGSKVITQTQIPPKKSNSIVRWEKILPTPSIIAPSRLGCPGVSGNTSLWTALSSDSWKFPLDMPKELSFSINYFEYIFLKWITSPFASLNREQYTKLNILLDLWIMKIWPRTIWWGTVCTYRCGPGQQHHLRIWTAYTQNPPWPMGSDTLGVRSSHCF